jgi:hypothetical protein
VPTLSPFRLTTFTCAIIFFQSAFSFEPPASSYYVPELRYLLVALTKSSFRHRRSFRPSLARG